MKKFSFKVIIFSVLTVFGITSCNFFNLDPSHGGGGKTTPTGLSVSNTKTNYLVGEEFLTPNVYLVNSDYSYEDVTSKSTFEGFDSSVVGNYTISVTYLEYDTSYQITVFDSESYYQSMTLDSVSFPSSYYSTGNYFNDGIFEYYRAVSDSGYAFTLKPLPKLNNVDSLGGSVYNTSAIKNIVSIELDYSCTPKLEVSPRLFYGEQNYNDKFVEIDVNKTSELFYLSEANYFRIDSGSSSLYINSVVINYLNTNTSQGSSFVMKNANEGEYRITPTLYKGTTFESGKTSVTVPTSVDSKTGKVLSSKKYTYYSYEYVSENTKYVDTAAMVDPVDVCNYFIAFGCAPANYGGSSISLRDGLYIPSKSEVSSLFGNKARTITRYNYTGGYVTSVPYYGSTPTYYELDIDVNGQYNVNSRQMGRIVAFATGFKGNAYSNGGYTVCVYTDDHYATFKEYNNYGGFLPRFNAERTVAGAKWSDPVTIK